jgi:hypothetical protein
VPGARHNDASTTYPALELIQEPLRRTDWAMGRKAALGKKIYREKKMRRCFCFILSI